MMMTIGKLEIDYYFLFICSDIENTSMELVTEA